MEALGVNVSSSPPLDLAQEGKDILDSARTSEWRREVTPTEKQADVGEGGVAKPSVVLDVRRFTETRDLPVGKNGFDKNLHSVDGKCIHQRQQDTAINTYTCEILLFLCVGAVCILFHIHASYLPVHIA